MLSAADLEAFRRNGFVQVPAAVPWPVVDACVEVIWSRLAERGVLRDVPSTWTAPVVRIDCPEGGADGEPFAQAGTTKPLWDAYDQLLGPHTWWKREGVGGTIPVRFPHPSDPGDAGWHVEASFELDGQPRANIRSRDRGLLALFLFSDVGPEDAPTRVRVGSHIDTSRLLALADPEQGLHSDVLAQLATAASAHRPVAQVTGSAGDVFLCHPFLVHAASWPHRGSTPRIIAQPGVALLTPFTFADRSAAHPVEAMILDALRADGQAEPAR